MKLTKTLSCRVFILLSISLLTFANTAFAENSESKTKTAIFAGGCFWCMEPPFDKLDGVISTTSGYISGHQKDPTYKQVSAGTSGHTEALKIVYDPDLVRFDELLEVFWVNIDPLNGKGQFCDFGSQYRTGIYYMDTTQQKLAEASRDEVIDKLGKLVATEIVAATTFYPAEDYHQNYYQVNPVRYNYYRWSCGRDQRLQELWGDKASH